jgi:triphosphatase
VRAQRRAAGPPQGATRIPSGGSAGASLATEAASVGAQHRGTAELEIKLRLPRKAVANVIRHPAVTELKVGRARRRSLVSTYFDTPNLRLAGAGVGLRIRRDGRQWIQTVKGPPESESGGGLAARPEYEWAIGRSSKMPPVDTTRLATTPWRRMLLKAARRGLAPMFVTDFHRTEIPLTLAEGTTAILAVDVGTIRTVNSARHIDLCEIELELVSGRIEHLFEIAQTLATDLPLSLEPASKSARGVRLVSSASAAPVRAENAEFSRDATAGDVLASIIRVCLRQVEGNADGIVHADDPEWIHQMRIGTRRLRASLSLLRHLVASDELIRLIAEVKWLAGALGPARDLDVLALETLPAVKTGARDAGDSVTASAMRPFAVKLGRRRKAARDEARAAVASRRFVQLVLTAATLAARPQFGTLPGSPAAATVDTPAREFASRLLERRQRKLLKRGTSLPHAPADERHAARIAAKKLRYATEFFADLFSGKRARTYRKALTHLQDVLGVLNDVTVAARLAREIAGSDSSAAATLQGWAAAQSTLASDDLARAWRDFSRCKPFWD